jgi:hypothetical protein
LRKRLPGLGSWVVVRDRSPLLLTGTVLEPRGPGVPMVGTKAHKVCSDVPFGMCFQLTVDVPPRVQLIDV